MEAFNKVLPDDQYFEDVYKDDRVITEVLNRWTEKYATPTWNTYTICLKRYAKYLNDGKYPQCWKPITEKKTDKGEQLKDQVLTEDEIQKVIRAASDPRDKALIGVWWEAGLRRGRTD